MNSAQPVPGSNPETHPGKTSDPQQTSTNLAQPVRNSLPAGAETNNRSTRAQPELFLSALRAYPVLESLIQQSHRTDIQNLARTNSEVHAILAAGGVSLTNDSTLWASCPNSKVDRCFWCGIPVCQSCTRDRKVTGDEISKLLFSRSQSNIPLCPSTAEWFNFLAKEGSWTSPVCSGCLGKSWADWIDADDELPRCTVCRLPEGHQ